MLVRYLLILLFLLISISPAYSLSVDRATDIEQDLSSVAGLMRLVPELKNARGQFEIPNPKTDLKKFLLVHHALTNVIEAALLQAAVKQAFIKFRQAPKLCCPFLAIGAAPKSV